jgi:molybdate transport system substrate-binding protein
MDVAGRRARERTGPIDRRPGRAGAGWRTGRTLAESVDDVIRGLRASGVSGPSRPATAARWLTGGVTAALIVLASFGLAAQRPATIAAAASLNAVLAEIARNFEREGGRVELVFGASGALTRQIRDGAPFEVFLAADEDFPNQLAAAGLARDRGTIYALGRLVLFAPRGSPLEVDERLEGLGRLVRAGGRERFAIANPEVAPYGRAAEALLRARGLWEPIGRRLVLGESVAQAAQFAASGNAAGALIAYSLVRSPGLRDRGAFALIPERDHPPLRQRMILLKKAGPVAATFYQYMQGRAARDVLRKYGFEVPQ